MWGKPGSQAFRVLVLMLSCLSLENRWQNCNFGLSADATNESGTDSDFQETIFVDIRVPASCEHGVSDRQVRPHSVSITEFGAIGDGKFLNTHAFENAIFYLRTFAGKGGAQLYIPPGQWLTGSFNLISHLTLYLDEGATLLGSQETELFPVVDPLPSYGRGLELPGGRYSSLIQGDNLTDVVITGDNGTIDGQGSIWWEMARNQTLDYSRGYLVEIANSNRILISNLNFLNPPSWSIHPVYCSNVAIRNITIRAPIDSPDTDGIDPDSCTDVCIEDCSIITGGDAISIKSGWDEYGMAYGLSSSLVHIRRVIASSPTSAGFSIGSEMSGGVSGVKVEDMVILDTKLGIKMSTSVGRGGYIVNVSISNIVMRNVEKAIVFTGLYGQHPDDNWDRSAYPVVERISINNVVGENIMQAGELLGLQEAPFHDIFLNNIALEITSGLLGWNCSEVAGSSSFVLPQPCPELQRPELVRSER